MEIPINNVIKPRIARASAEMPNAGSMLRSKESKELARATNAKSNSGKNDREIGLRIKPR